MIFNPLKVFTTVSNSYEDYVKSTFYIGIVNISSVYKYPEFIQATDFTVGTFPL